MCLVSTASANRAPERFQALWLAANPVAQLAQIGVAERPRSRLAGSSAGRNNRLVHDRAIHVVYYAI